MKVHLICRGNAFRSLIAEAYLKSLHLADIEVASSGTKARENYDSNVPNYLATLRLLNRHGLSKYAKPEFGDDLTYERVKDADIVICMNALVYDEASKICELPGQVIVWSVEDVDERGHVLASEAEREQIREEVYREIVRNVDDLVELITSPRPR